MTMLRGTTSSLARLLFVTATALPVAAQVLPGEPEDPADKAVGLATDEHGIVWHDDLIEAHLEADKTGRPIALYVRSTLCDSCDKLRDETLTDERVLELAQTFTWVLYDKSRDKAELNDFHVFTFPSILVLGPENENIHRIEGFRPPPMFLADLDEALRRYSLFEKGEKWDARKPRPGTLFPGRKTETMGLPIDEPGHGVTFVEGKLFVAQARNLFGFDAETLEWKTSFPLPMKNVRDLCTDGTLIYVLPWGWSKGEPIHAVDPTTGETVIEIVTERNKKQRHSSAQGIEWFKGELYVLADRGRIYIINPTDGKIRISIGTDTPGYGLVYDGEHMVTVNQRGVHFMTVSGQHVRSIATNYPLGSVGFKDGVYHLFESEIRGFDRLHRFIRIWPEKVLLYKTTLN